MTASTNLIFYLHIYGATTARVNKKEPVLNCTEMVVRQRGVRMTGWIVMERIAAVMRM